MKMVRPEKRLISSAEEDLGEVGLKGWRLIAINRMQWANVEGQCSSMAVMSQIEHNLDFFNKLKHI